MPGDHGDQQAHRSCDDAGRDGTGDRLQHGSGGVCIFLATLLTLALAPCFAAVFPHAIHQGDIPMALTV